MFYDNCRNGQCQQREEKKKKWKWKQVREMNESKTRSREEDVELQRSMKKVKENHCIGDPCTGQSPLGHDGNWSYKDKLLDEILGAFEQAFDIGYNMEMKAEFDDEFLDHLLGEKAVKLSGSMKSRVRALWTNALIVKVVGRTVGYSFLHSCILSLWKPSGKMKCVNLGQDFFLFRFLVKEDYIRVLKGGPWFIGGHYLSIKHWEPNFKVLTTNLLSVAIWVRLPELPIKYYEPSVLQEIGEAIGPVLKIDTHTVVESKGWFARLCVQINFDELITKLLKVGGIDQLV